MLLLIKQIFIVQTLHAQLAHFAVQLLRLRHFRQARHLRTQRLAQQIGGAEPLRLFTNGAERLTNLNGLIGGLTLLRGDKIETLRLLVQRGGQLPVDVKLFGDRRGQIAAVFRQLLGARQRLLRFALTQAVKLVAQRLQIVIQLLRFF